MGDTDELTGNRNQYIWVLFHAHLTVKKAKIVYLFFCTCVKYCHLTCSVFLNTETWSQIFFLLRVELGIASTCSFCVCLCICLQLRWVQPLLRSPGYVKDGRHPPWRTRACPLQPAAPRSWQPSPATMMSRSDVSAEGQESLTFKLPLTPPSTTLHLIGKMWRLRFLLFTVLRLTVLTYCFVKLIVQLLAH